MQLEHFTGPAQDTERPDQMASSPSQHSALHIEASAWSKAEPCSWCHLGSDLMRHLLIPLKFVFFIGFKLVYPRDLSRTFGFLIEIHWNWCVVNRCLVIAEFGVAATAATASLEAYSGAWVPHKLFVSTDLGFDATIHHSVFLWARNWRPHGWEVVLGHPCLAFSYRRETVVSMITPKLLFGIMDLCVEVRIRFQWASHRLYL